MDDEAVLNAPFSGRPICFWTPGKTTVVKWGALVSGTVGNNRRKSIEWDKRLQRVKKIGYGEVVETMTGVLWIWRGI